MKKFLTLLILGITGSVLAQDTIITRSGEIIPARVYEITQTEIKYKKPANPDGPLYVTSKENVALIQYKNGTKDVFKLEEQTDDVYHSAPAGRTSSEEPYYTQSRVNVVLAPPAIVVGRGWRHHPRLRWRNYCWRWGLGWWW